MKEKTRHAPPRAIAMLESLRGLGYSTAAALADIIDNSISAGASEVKVDFEQPRDSYPLICFGPLSLQFCRSRNSANHRNIIAVYCANEKLPSSDLQYVIDRAACFLQTASNAQ